MPVTNPGGAGIIRNQWWLPQPKPLPVPSPQDRIALSPAITGPGGRAGAYTPGTIFTNQEGTTAISPQSSSVTGLQTVLNTLGGQGLLPTSGGSVAREPRVAYPTAQINAAQDLAFARAKDRAGQNARAALTALYGEMAGRGIARSGIEGEQAANVIQGSESSLADLLSRQASESAAQQVKGLETQYGGDITQRGQDINAALEAERLRTGQAQSLAGLLSSLRGLY